FTHVFNILKKQNQEQKAFALYGYYLAVMLKNYYTMYDDSKKIKEYDSLVGKLKNLCDKGEFPEEEQRTVLEKIAKDLQELASTFRKTSKIKDWLGFSNIYRIHFTFCRIFLRQSILFERNFKWFIQLQNIVGRNADDLVNVI